MWEMNSTERMVVGYFENLKRLKGLSFDAGDRDTAIAAAVRALDVTLTANQVPHSSAIYSGTHTSGVAQRLEENLLPFFSTALSSTVGN